MGGTFKWPSTVSNNFNSIVLNGATSGTLTFTVPAIVSSYSIIFPAAQGTGALVNDGSGNLSWNSTGGITFGDLTDVGTDGIVVTGGTGAVKGSGTSIAQHVADTTHNGYLSSTDWNTFNSKQTSGNYITALTGDVTATGPGSVASTVAKIAGIAVGTPTGTTNVVFSNSPTLVSPALGTPTALVGTNITGTAASLTAGHVTTNANLTGDVTSVGNAATLVATTNATLTTLSALASVGTITTGVWNAGAITTTGQFTLNSGSSSGNFNAVFGNAAANVNYLIIRGDGALQTQKAFCTQNYDVSTATSGTITATLSSPGLSITGAGGTTLTIQLPGPSPVNGQQYWVTSAGNFTTVTWQDNGGTASNVVGGQASLGGTSRGQRFVYVSGQTKWYSIG